MYPDRQRRKVRVHLLPGGEQVLISSPQHSRDWLKSIFKTLGNERKGQWSNTELLFLYGLFLRQVPFLDYDLSLLNWRKFSLLTQVPADVSVPGSSPDRPTWNPPFGSLLSASVMTTYFWGCLTVDNDFFQKENPPPFTMIYSYNLKQITHNDLLFMSTPKFELTQAYYVPHKAQFVFH